LKQDGLCEVAHVGSHKQFKHPVKPGRVTVPHPVRDMPISTLRSVEKMAGNRLRRLMDYIAYLHKNRKSDFGVSCPDFPGCITTGRTLEEARRRAAEALSFHMAGLIQDGEKIPIHPLLMTWWMILPLRMPWRFLSLPILNGQSAST
jgi:predicted RNase H-like HicB family nuclease/predicted RNA binding protein YcfA (HicA-like mRNA interferase family)